MIEYKWLCKKCGHKHFDFEECINLPIKEDSGKMGKLIERWETRIKELEKERKGYNDELSCADSIITEEIHQIEACIDELMEVLTEG